MVVTNKKFPFWQKIVAGNVVFLLLGIEMTKDPTQSNSYHFKKIFHIAYYNLGVLIPFREGGQSHSYN